MQNQPTCLNEMMNGWTTIYAWCIKNPHKIMQVNGTMPGLKLQQHFCTTVQPTETPSGGIRSHSDYTQTNTGEKSFIQFYGMCASTHTHAHTYMYTHTHIHAHTHTHTCMQACMHACTHSCTHACTHTHTPDSINPEILLYCFTSFFLA